MMTSPSDNKATVHFSFPWSFQNLTTLFLPMPLAVTHQEPGWTNLRADATDLLKDASALKVYSAVRELVATADPDVIAMLCAAFLFALDGHKLTKFPDESRVWYVVAETQYTLAVTGLEEPADPPPDIKKNMGGENALLEQKELGVTEGPEKYAGKERGPAGTAKNLQNRPNSSATPKSSGPVAKVITKPAKYKPGPKLYSLRSKGPPPPLQARKRKAGKQVPKILPAEKRLAVDDNVVIEVEIPKFSPFKKARLESPAGPSKPRGIPPKPILTTFLKRSAPQPMRGRARGLRTPSTPRSKQVVGPPEDRKTPEQSPESFARFYSPGSETNTKASLLNTPQPFFKDASFPPAPQPVPPPTFYSRTQSLIGPSFPAFSAIAADDARDAPMATNATAGHERPWYENTASGDQAQIAATLNTLFSSVPITKASSASTFVHARHTTSPPSPLTPSSSQSFQLSSPPSTIVAEALARKISSQAKTLNLLFQGYDKERDEGHGDGEDRTWSGSTERPTVASSITPGQVLAQAQAEKQRQQYLASMAHASSDSSPALSTASVGTGAETGTEQGTTTGG
ncbi:hypothetical protein BC938DRAFT_479194 [Jimgerdemannia flammicorona]|uniref:Uncharacterized protein n=1 Tax=Jimgerdemannia flammicorona TaxID=994334 RepID=A0A433QY79_9FUNG|nr:hypothetical protein BC938DRAFT_479194 [Jimgerdemannia flammicorona]